MSELKVVAEGNPYFREMLEEAMRDAAGGKVTAMALVYIQNDKIYTDWVKSCGTSICEILGAIQVLNTELIERMRGDV